MPFEFSSKAEGFGYINNQLFQLEQQIQQILADRASFLHQLNDLQSSDSILPNEILSYIFVKACEDPDKAISPIILGAVCSRWRRIAWGTRSLWSSIGPIPRRPIRQSDVEILRVYFQNTAQHPIHLNLRLDCLPPKRQDTKDFLYVIFVENPLKVQKLTLSTTNSAATMALIEQALERSNLPNLSTMSFLARKRVSEMPTQLLPSMPTQLLPSMPTQPLPAKLLHSAINLRTLIVDSYQLPWWRISCDPITILELRNIPLDQCLHLLSNCPKMVEFYCSSTRRPRTGIGRFIHPMKELRNLETFDVNLDHEDINGALFTPNDQWITFLLVHFRFPNLKHMVWGTLPVLQRHQFASFLSAMKFLITFKCTRSLHDDYLVQLFELLSPTVRKVYLPRFSSNLERSLPHLLERIVNTIVYNSQGMRTLELAFPKHYPTIFTLELCTLIENLRGVGVNLLISEAFEP